MEFMRAKYSLILKHFDLPEVQPCTLNVTLECAMAFAL